MEYSNESGVHRVRLACVGICGPFLTNQKGIEYLSTWTWYKKRMRERERGREGEGETERVREKGKKKRIKEKNPKPPLGNLNLVPSAVRPIPRLRDMKPMFLRPGSGKPFLFPVPIKTFRLTLY
jgi:hypothetical protein